MAECAGFEQVSRLVWDLDTIDDGRPLSTTCLRQLLEQRRWRREEHLIATLVSQTCQQCCRIRTRTAQRGGKLCGLYLPIGRTPPVLGYKPDILVLDPHDLDDILVSIMDIAERVGRVSEGRKLVVSLQNRIDNIKVIVGESRGRRRGSMDGIDNTTNEANPRIVCIEWIDPFFTAGHWIPQMVDIAGGSNGLGSVGQPSRRVSIDKIVEFNPDKIILMPCGFDINRTSKEAKALENNDKWKSLQAVRRNEVYAVDANAYFSKPGPRTVTGVEILAKIMYPESSRLTDLPANSFTNIRTN